MDEIERRKAVIEKRETDVERWRDPAQLEAAWEARAALAAQFIAAGTRVADIGCGAMKLEKHLPYGCTYLPSDVVARDARTVTVDLNRAGPPSAYLSGADLVVMLGVWEYLYTPERTFEALAAAGKPILCSYCPTELSAHADRRALGWVNDLSLAQLTELAARHGYRISARQQIDDLQYLIKFVREPAAAPAARKRVHVISYYNVGNFGDRLGFHQLADVLPAGAEVSWGTFQPFSDVPQDLDLLIIGFGNSLFANLVDDRLLAAARSAKRAVGIFGTQYRERLSAEAMARLVDSLTHWFARYRDDISFYGRDRANVSHLGDWLINSFAMTRGTDERFLKIGQEIWQNLPLDRTIQFIQRHRRVHSDRIHPLLCALTSAEEVSFTEQREMEQGEVSGKFRSMLIDIFDRTYPENLPWRVDRERVAGYKTLVRANTEVLRQKLAEFLR